VQEIEITILNLREVGPRRVRPIYFTVQELPIRYLFALADHNEADRAVSAELREQVKRNRKNQSCHDSVSFVTSVGFASSPLDKARRGNVTGKSGRLRKQEGEFL
jgi:hypothetical protein